MTISEPAGAGTAEMIAERIVKRHWGWRDAKPEADIASAITAAESRAMERCAKMLDQLAEAEAAMSRGAANKQKAAEYASAGRAFKAAAGYIRSSISPQGTEE